MKKMLLAGICVFALAGTAHADKFVLSMKGPGAGNPYWAAVEEGAKAKGKELGVDVIVVAPPAETDVQSQINQLEDLIAQKVDGIALAPTDPNSLAEVIESAKTAGIKTVFVDGAGTNEGVPFIGTNNLEGGKLAGEYMCKNLPKGSEVAILQGIMSTTNGVDRAG